MRPAAGRHGGIAQPAPAAGHPLHAAASFGFPPVADGMNYEAGPVETADPLRAAAADTRASRFPFTRGGTMNIRASAKEAGTIAVGMPLTFVLGAAAAGGLALLWIGVKSIDAFAHRR